jgi:hypothetical protein
MRLSPLALGALLALPACAPAARDAPLAAPPASARDSVPQLDIGVRHDPATIAAILAEGMQRSRAADDLRYLTGVIGPRLTGSDGMRRAAEWMAERLRAYGADSVWLEPVSISRGWARGPFSLRLVSPHERWLQGASVGWAPGTEGEVEGDVVHVDARSEREFRERFRGRLRGAWVITRAPMPMFDVFRPSAADSARVRDARAALLAPPADSAGERYLALRDSLLVAEGIAGTIMSSDKDRGLLTMSGTPRSVRARPALIVSHETFTELHRLLAGGERVRLAARVENRFLGPTVSHNVIAELRGGTSPDETVILGAHLDSWDLATGATDNGAGVVAVTEALRVIAATGKRPARSIRVVLFTGEEQGLLGSSAYVAAHASELGRVQAVLVVDNGSGRISGIALQGRDELRVVWERLFRPLAPLGPFAVEHRVRTGSDHLPFLRAGVPAYLVNQEFKSYDWTWHTQADGYDNIVAGDLPQIGTVLAGVAWGLADAERPISRAAPPTR